MLKIVNPYTYELIQEVSPDNESSVRAKWEKAHLAQAEWKHTPLMHRMEIVARFRVLMQDNMKQLAEVLTSETGKPITQAQNEIKGTQGRLDFFLQSIESALKTDTVFSSNGNEEKISWDPLGVVANISAWNYPYFVGTNVFIPAILTGNTVLYKPSEYSTLTGMEFTKLFKQAGLPEGVFTLVVGGRETAESLLEQKLNGVFFTGSRATGVSIAKAVAGQMCKVQLELGGKDPVYVRDDANVKVAAESLADGAFYNTGQSCCSVERIYVHEFLYKEFVEHFVKTVKDFKIGDPSSPETYIGPLTRKQQLQVLIDQVKDATAKGAKLELGGDVWAEHEGFFQPTVLSQTDHTMEVMREESFGPIIGIQPVRSDEEAIQLMNDTEYGLTAGVFTGDQEEAEEFLSQVNAGTVYWNCCDRVSPRLPWTGRQGSGIGSTLSMIGIRSFLQPKAWHLVQPKI
ncbi:MAG: aldehyde dehydrogenase family protein [Bdellovibrionaceae bacterium]|nr:aldehyde dehydrogenase family protein [Bdellovibrionales bacterium]MCB9084147.1 aldehyde dehydrogenase family protein [Pseudobdellovibrionaceae bacterium]